MMIPSKRSKPQRRTGADVCQRWPLFRCPKTKNHKDSSKKCCVVLTMNKAVLNCSQCFDFWQCDSVQQKIWTTWICGKTCLLWLCNFSVHRSDQWFQNSKHQLHSKQKEIHCGILSFWWWADVSKGRQTRVKKSMVNKEKQKWVFPHRESEWAKTAMIDHMVVKKSKRKNSAWSSMENKGCTDTMNKIHQIFLEAHC